MAGIVTAEHTNYNSGINKMVIDWLSDTAGAATITTDPIRGLIHRVVFIPDSGATQPTNLYDVTLKDENEVDVLQAGGANLANNATTSVIPLTDNNAGTDAFHIAVCDNLDLAVSNAGSENGGQIIIYYEVL